MTESTSCTGFSYALNSDAPDEGSDLHHTRWCPVHPDAFPSGNAEARAQIDELIHGLFDLRSFLADHPEFDAMPALDMCRVLACRLNADDYAETVRVTRAGAGEGSLEAYDRSDFVGVRRKFGPLLSLDVYTYRAVLAPEQVEAVAS